MHDQIDDFLIQGGHLLQVPQIFVSSFVSHATYSPGEREHIGMLGLKPGHCCLQHLHHPLIEQRDTGGRPLPGRRLAMLQRHEREMRGLFGDAQRHESLRASAARHGIGHIRDRLTPLADRARRHHLARKTRIDRLLLMALPLSVQVRSGCRQFLPFVCRPRSSCQLERSLVSDRYLSKNDDTQFSRLQGSSAYRRCEPCERYHGHLDETPTTRIT